MRSWIRDRALTLVLMAMFLVFLAAQLVTGLHEYNATQAEHGRPPVLLSGYLTTGHPWEALFENWESEFLQMAAFVLLTTFLVQRGSPESRRPGVKELVDADPRDFANATGAPWPVRRGGWVLRLYEHSLGLAFVLLFLGSWVGHAAGGYAVYAADQAEHGQIRPELQRVSELGPFLVRVVPELAERVPLDRLDGVAGRVLAAALVARIEARPHSRTTKPARRGS